MSFTNLPNWRNPFHIQPELHLFGCVINIARSLSAPSIPRKVISTRREINSAGLPLIYQYLQNIATYKSTRNLCKATPRLWECCRQVEAEVVSISRNKILQTGERPCSKPCIFRKAANIIHLYPRKNLIVPFLFVCQANSHPPCVLLSTASVRAPSSRQTVIQRYGN